MATTFEAIFTALDSTGGRDVVVGGIAVNLHGYQRFTKDVDLVIGLISDHAVRALEALQTIGYSRNNASSLMKKEAGRPQDGADLAMLEKLKVLLAEPKKNANVRGDDAEAQSPTLRSAAERLRNL